MKNSPSFFLLIILADWCFKIMNICFFLSSLNRGGGIGRVTTILADSYAEKYRNDNIFVLAYCDDHSGYVYHTGNKVNYSSLYSKSMSVTKSLWQGMIQKLCAFVKYNKIDIMVACGTNFYVPVVITCRLCHTKSICWEHTGPHVSTDHSMQMQCRKIGAKLSSCNVLLTQKTYNIYGKEFCKKEKNYVRYNPIDPKAEKRAGYYDEQSNKIIAVGRLSYQKNIELMIDIFAEIFKEYPEWKLDIYGDGERYDNLSKLITEKKMGKNIFLKGRALNIYDLYSQYSFIVSTSRYEGFPMTLLEASVNGLPMISFDVETGPSEVIKNGENGFLIDVEDINHYKESVKSLIESQKRRKEMSLKSKEISKVFKLDYILDEWNGLFFELFKH